MHAKCKNHTHKITMSIIAPAEFAEVDHVKFHGHSKTMLKNIVLKVAVKPC